MSSTLKSLLGRFRILESIELAAIVANDGLLIESNAHPGVDVDAICAVASNGLAIAHALGKEVSKGQMVQTMLEYEQGVVFIEPISGDAMLLLVSTIREEIGHVRFLAAMHRADLADALSAI